MSSSSNRPIVDFELIRKLITNMPMIFYVVDRDWKFILSEGQGLVKLGLVPGQVVGMSAYEMYQGFPDIIQAIERAFKGETVQMDHALGELRLGNYLVPLYNQVGGIDGVAGAAIDITATWKAQSELDRTTTLIKAMIDSIPGILYLYNSRGQLVYWNKGHEAMTGYSAEELAKTVLADWYRGDPESLARIQTALERTAKEGYGEAEAPLLCKDGSRRPFYLTACPLKIDGDDCFVGVGVDISSRLRAEQALLELNRSLEFQVNERTADLEQANADLRASNEELRQTNDKIRRMQDFVIESEKMAALGGLVAGVAHEVNTPLGIGVTAASHLADLAADMAAAVRAGKLGADRLEEFLAELKEASDIVLNNLNRASRLVKSFKQLSVDQSGEPCRQYSVPEYLDEVLLSLSPTLKKTRIRLQVVCPDRIVINSFPGAFAQIVTNLVMNSLTLGFGPGEVGDITIGLKPAGAGLPLEYADTGRGMEAEVLERMYEPFFTTRRHDGGTGLGLSVVFSLVTQKMHGTIGCESAPGRGTRFTIHLEGEPVI